MSAAVRASWACRWRSGASKAGIVGFVLRQVGTTIIVGAMAGVAGVMMTNGMLRAALVKTDTDPDVVVLISAAVVLMITALSAAMGPALRAERVDPKTALHAQ